VGEIGGTCDDMSLRILSLGVENVKRIKVIRIVPNGNTVTISGKNDQGKTSVLDSIEYALGGKASICEEPIRNGQAKARIVCDLGDYVVERTFSAVSGDSEIRIKGKDGRPVKSPQTLLDSLCSHVAFEPLSFVRQKPDEQMETLRKLVGLDFTELNARRKKAFEDRTLAGRQLDQVKANLKDAPFDEGAPAKEVSVVELSERLNQARQKNGERTKAVEKVNGLKSDLASNEARRASVVTQIESLEIQLKELRRQDGSLVLNHNAISRSITVAEAEAAKIPTVDESAIAAEIAASEATNARVRANVRHQSIQADIAYHQNTYDRLTFEIESIDGEKWDKLEWTEFPLEGLSFDDSRVLLNGVPFSQSSQARQLQAAVAIGLALNPKVRVILIRDGSLLDEESMKLIGDMAVKHDAQIWIERVESKDPAAVVIEDGEVKS
jgi:DNA repair exonuclease SbcCD ATPase subunit